MHDTSSIPLRKVYLLIRRNIEGEDSPSESKLITLGASRLECPLQLLKISQTTFSIGDG